MKNTMFKKISLNQADFFIENIFEKPLDFCIPIVYTYGMQKEV